MYAHPVYKSLFVCASLCMPLIDRLSVGYTVFLRETTGLNEKISGFPALHFSLFI